MGEISDLLVCSHFLLGVAKEKKFPKKFCNVQIRKNFSSVCFFFIEEVNGVGKHVARRACHTVLTQFWEKGDFSRPDAVFGLFFAVYELADIPTVYLIKRVINRL